jgi:hypothetical protein
MRAVVEQRTDLVSDTWVSVPSAGANKLVELLFDLDQGDAVHAQVDRSRADRHDARVPLSVRVRVRHAHCERSADARTIAA